MTNQRRQDVTTTPASTNFAIEELEDHRRELTGYALSLTRHRDRAEDLVQRAFVRALSRGRQFEAGTNLRAWLFTITRNCHIDDMRRNQRRGTHVDIDDMFGLPATPSNQEESVELSEFRTCLRELSNTDREILLMIAVEGESYEHAAETLGIALGTVKSRLSRARNRLREMMSHDEIYG